MDRAQASVEYLIIYGLVLLTAALAAYALFSLGIFSPASTASNTVSGFNGFGVSQACIPGGALIFTIENTQSIPVSITSINITLSNNTVKTVRTSMSLQPSESGSFFALNSCPTKGGVSYYNTASIGFVTGNPVNSGPFPSSGSISGTSAYSYTLPGFAQFNGQTSTIVGPSCTVSGPGCPPLNLEPDFGVFVWIQLENYPSAGKNASVYSEGNTSVYLNLYIKSNGDLCIATYNTVYAGKSVNLCSTSTVPLNAWTLVGATLTAGGAGTGTFNLYINSNSYSGSGNEENGPGKAFGIGSDVASQFGVGQPFSALSANVSNLQVYAQSVPKSQVSQIVSDGSGSGPLLNDSLVLWMPLVGSALDFSGNLLSGSVQNVNFIT